MTVKCSQGTYIRTLAADLGAALGCGAHLTALRRLVVGPFRLTDAATLAALEAAGREARLARIIPLAACLPAMRQVRVDSGDAAKLRQGQALAWQEEGLPPAEPVQVLTAGELLAVARVMDRGDWLILTPIRVFAGHQDTVAEEPGPGKSLAASPERIF
jgi:tRNA pseudouridine55 synthase